MMPKWTFLVAPFLAGLSGEAAPDPHGKPERCSVPLRYVLALGDTVLSEVPLLRVEWSPLEGLRPPVMTVNA